MTAAGPARRAPRQRPRGAERHALLLAASAAGLALAAGRAGWRPAGAVEPHDSMRGAGGSTIDRLADGVVMELGAIPELAGTPLGHLRVARWDADAEAWADAPFQVDERIERDRYTLAERGAGEGVDANDELVALVRHLGGRAPACAWPPASDGALERWDLEVTDPLSPGDAGWLHLFASPGEPQAVPTLIAWDRRAQTLTSVDFTLTQARSFPGLETLTLYDSPVDVLDRSKVRADVYVEGSIDLPGPLPDPTFVFDETYTEESREVQQAAGEFVFNPVKQGPVRLVLEVDGAGFAYPGQVEVFAAFGRIELPALPREVMELVDKLELEFRLSLDFAAEALPGRYADPNATAGVPIDGSHDQVPEKPIGEWRQVDTPHGGVVVVAARPLALRSLGTYYNDRGRDEPPGTGDNRAYGENGVSARELDAVEEAANFLGWLVVVPPGSDIVGERVQRELRTPLVVRPTRVAREVCLRPTKTVPPTSTVEPTPTLRPTRTATPSPPPSAAPPPATATPRALLLPAALRDAAAPPPPTSSEEPGAGGTR